MNYNELMERVGSVLTHHNLTYKPCTEFFEEQDSETYRIEVDGNENCRKLIYTIVTDREIDFIEEIVESLSLQPIAPFHLSYKLNGAIDDSIKLTLHFTKNLIKKTEIGE